MHITYKVDKQGSLSGVCHPIGALAQRVETPGQTKHSVVGLTQNTQVSATDERIQYHSSCNTSTYQPLYSASGQDTLCYFKRGVDWEPLGLSF